jgi:hypothetical protein
VSWWQVLLLCWIFYVLGFATATLLVAARDNLDDDYKVGLNDD